MGSAAPLIAPFTIGLQKNRDPWQCAPNSFQQLHNARIEYGYVTSQKGIIFRGTLPSGLPITGITSYLVEGVGKNNLIWDTQNLYLKSELPLRFTQLNTTPLFKTPFERIQWTEMNTEKEGNCIFFTSGLGGSQGKEPIWIYNPLNKETLQEYPLSQSEESNSLTLLGAKLILSIAGRLVLFGTTEQLESSQIYTYDYRARWSAAGNPLNLLEGGYADAATAGELIAVEAFQNGAIVCFSNGLWMLESTFNALRPFVWRKIDGNVRCFSSQSLISYPLEVKIIGERGYLKTDGRNVERTDENIPLFIEENFDYTLSSTFCGFRDYINQTAWYLYSEKGSSQTRKALIFDELTQSYSTFEVPFKILGNGSSDVNYSFQDFSEANNMYWTLDSQLGKRLCDYQQGGEEKIYGGDNQGNLYELSSGFEQILPNQEVYYKESILETAAWNPFIQEGKQSRLVYLDLFLEGNQDQKLKVSFFKDNEEYPYVEKEIDLLPYLGFVGDIENISYTSSVITLIVPDHGLIESTPLTLYGVEGLESLNNQTFVFSVVDSMTLTTSNVMSLSGNYVTGGRVYLKSFSTTKTWKRVYAGGTGFLHKVRLTFKGSPSPYFKLHAFKPKFLARGKRLI